MENRTKVQKNRKKYSQEDVYNALEAIQKGVTIRKAAEQFKVPKTTLWAKLDEIIPVEGVRGPNTILTYNEEKHIVKWIFHCSERGFPISKSQLFQTIQKLVIELKRPNPFTNNMPGRHWWESFCRRHPEISPRLAQNLSISRAYATEEVLRVWFQEVETHLNKINLHNIDPSRIFNLDESAFFLVPKTDRVLARRGAKSVYKVVHEDEKESITTLFTVNAAGTMLPPMILFWYQRIPTNITNTLPPEWIIGNTDRGWMTAESFLDYITTKFHPWLVTNRIKFPVIFYLNGHSSHMTLALSQFCKANQIELIALYPNATHVLQPLDVAVFHPLKAAWKKAVDEWRTTHSQKLKRENFAPILKTDIDSFSNLQITIQHGFRVDCFHIMQMQ